MPIPRRKEKEAKSDFITRCLRDKVMNEEYPETKQRAAICYQQTKK